MTPADDEPAWYQRNEYRYLLRANGDRATEFALTADYAERIAALMLLNLSVAAGVLVVADAGTRAWANMASFGFVVLAMAVAKSAAETAAEWYETELTIGLGLPDPA